MSLLNKLESLLKKSGPSNQSHSKTPKVGFKLTLENGPDESNPMTLTPELHVNLIGARNLPVSFGSKCVEGYIIKVKLFPGNIKHDSSIQATSQPIFGETFRFPLGDVNMPSFTFLKRLINSEELNEILPELLVEGSFVAFTIYALLEIPPGFTAPLQYKTMNFLRQGSHRLKGKLRKDVETSRSKIKKLTTCESQQKIGSVTYNLDPKAFKEMCRGLLYRTDEMWLPIKDISSKKMPERIVNSPKGEIEVTLQLSDCTDVNLDDWAIDSSSSSSSSNSYFSRNSSNNSQNNESALLSPFTFSGAMRFVKSVLNTDNDAHKGVCLKIYTAKFRCSRKVKQEFEAINETIYLKTSILRYDQLTEWWKSEPFRPTLSARWKPDNCTIVVPLNSISELARITIRVYVAAINKAGEKVYLGEVKLGSNASKTSSIKEKHWQKMISCKGTPISVWHTFE